jgi:hypothetical protein
MAPGQDSGSVQPTPIPRLAWWYLFTALNYENALYSEGFVTFQQRI